MVEAEGGTEYRIVQETQIKGKSKTVTTEHTADQHMKIHEDKSKRILGRIIDETFSDDHKKLREEYRTRQPSIAGSSSRSEHSGK